LAGHTVFIEGLQHKSTLGSSGGLGLAGAGTAEVSSMSDFARLLEVEIPRLRRYARALTRDRVRADDLVQECLVRAIAKQHLWQPGTDLRAWLFTILHNQHVNEVRRSLREGIKVTVEGVAPTLTVVSDATASLQLRDLERAIAALPAGQRQVVLLVGLEGISYEKVAAVLNVPIGTVRSRLSRGRHMLRQLMGMTGRATQRVSGKRVERGGEARRAA
jgi:RNA polymerase sigma-70 factor, ECF subfamily